MSETPTAPDRQGPRTELKIQLGPDAFPELRAFCAQRLQPDPHVADPARPSYLVESVYLDTPELHAFGEDDFPKYRVRRYDGVNGSLHLEEKLSHSPQVWKRRVPCTADEVARVLGPPAAGLNGLGWFHGRALQLELAPRMAVAYRRHAYHDGNGLRVTFDDRIRVASVDDPVAFLPVGAGEAIDGAVVLELKYEGERPALVEEFLARVPEPAPFSKYRRGMRLLGGA